MDMPELTLVIFYAFNALRVGPTTNPSGGTGRQRRADDLLHDLVGVDWRQRLDRCLRARHPPNCTLFAVNTLNAICCALVVALTVLKRHQYAARNCGGAEHA